MSESTMLRYLTAAEACGPMEWTEADYHCSTGALHQLDPWATEYHFADDCHWLLMGKGSETTLVVLPPIRLTEWQTTYWRPVLAR